MVKRIRESDEGFSLVELLLVLALLGLVLSLGFTAYALGTKMYSRSADQAMVQQQERYLIEFLPRELRYAYDVELFASLEEVPVLEDSQTILYSDTRGVWQKEAGSDARLVLAAEQAAGDIVFRRQEGTGTLVVGYRVALNRRSPAVDYKEVPVRLFNSELTEGASVDQWAGVIRYTK